LSRALMAVRPLGFSSAAAGDLSGDGDGDCLGGALFFNEAGFQDTGAHLSVVLT